MGVQIDGNRPIYLQIAENIANDIIEKRVPEETKVPSTNEFAVFYQINPATAAKGVNLLVDQGILYKKRGIGMFVKSGARDKLITQRKQEFYRQFIVPMLAEAKKLNMTEKDLVELMNKGESRHD